MVEISATNELTNQLVLTFTIIILLAFFIWNKYRYDAISVAALIFLVTISSIPSLKLNIINIDEGILNEKNYKKIKEITNNPSLNNYQKAIGNYLLSINEKRNKNFKNEIHLLEKAYLFLDKAKTKIQYQSELYFKNILPKFWNKKKMKGFFFEKTRIKWHFF